MNIAKDILHDLREKTLWPVALLLVIALVVIPMMLSKPGTSSVVASAPAPTSSDSAGPELSLTRASTTGFARSPRVNDREIDPFGVQSKAYAAFIKTLKKSLTTASAGADTGITTGSGGVDTSGSGGVTPTDNNNTPSNSGGNTPTDNTPKSTTPKVKTESDHVISVVVTQDDDSAPVELDDVRTLSPLPDADNPFLVYVAETEDNQAQFIVASNAVATGDGTCSPSPQDCSTLLLAEGQTEKFAVTTTDNTVSPPVTKTANVSITLTDIGLKKVVVDDGTDETASAARFEARARAVGARVVKQALVDPEIGKILMKHHVIIP